MGSKLGNLGAVSCIPFVLCHLVPSRRASRPRFFSDLAHLAVFALSIDRFSFLGGIICACCGVVPSPLYIDLTRASHRGICLKGIRLRRSLPLPQTDTRKNPIRGKKNGRPTLLYQPRQRSWLRPPPERLANRTAMLCPRKPSTANMGGNMDFCPSLALSLSSTCVPRTRFAIAPPGGIVLLGYILVAD